MGTKRRSKLMSSRRLVPLSAKRELRKKRFLWRSWRKISRISLRTFRKSIRTRATKKIKTLKPSKAADWDFSKRFMRTRKRQVNPSCKTYVFLHADLGAAVFN